MHWPKSQELIYFPLYYKSLSLLKTSFRFASEPNRLILWSKSAQNWVPATDLSPVVALCVLRSAPNSRSALVYVNLLIIGFCLPTKLNYIRIIIIWVMFSFSCDSVVHSKLRSDVNRNTWQHRHKENDHSCLLDRVSRHRLDSQTSAELNASVIYLKTNRQTLVHSVLELRICIWALSVVIICI